MKFFKKCFSVLLVLLFICTSTAIIKADNNFVVYTKSDSDFDDYAKDHAFDFIDSHDLVLSSSDVTLATGIYVYSDDNSEEMIYPVLCNNNVVLTIEVFKEGDNIGGSSSYNFVDFFNSIKNNTSSTNPLVIHKTSGKLYASVGNTLYNMNGGLYTGPTSSIRITGVVSSVDSIKTIDMTQTRSGFGYCSWNNIPVTGHNNSHCVTISLFMIYHNMGYTDYSTWQDLDSDFMAVNGITQSIGYFDIIHITNFFQNKNIHHDSLVSSGCMTISDIYTMTYTNHRYGLAFCANSDDTKRHVTAIIGFSYSNYGNYAVLYNPHGSGDCRVTLDLNGGCFSSPDYGYLNTTTTYYWSNGYYANIYK